MTKVFFVFMAGISLIGAARCAAHGHAPSSLLFAISAAINAAGLFLAVYLEDGDP